MLAIVLLFLAVVTLLIVPLWAIALGALERQRIRILKFDTMPSGHVRLGREQRPHWLSIRLAEPATWRESAALFVDIVLGFLSLALLFVEFAALAIPVAIVVTASNGPQNINLFADVYVTVGPGNMWPAVAAAAVLLVMFAYLNTVIGGGHASLLRVLCGPRQEELERNVERLTHSRAALVAGFEAERRRVERDLHDGVQQELVTLGARLAMLNLDLDDLEISGADTALVRASLTAAQNQTERAMATLRDTVRGIHPAVLTDHGLADALSELATRVPVRLSLDVNLPERMPSTHETAAYYVVTEAITNSAKHTTATYVAVEAHVEGGSLHMDVTDNGHGGADMDSGTGLLGLRERAETLNGTLGVTSPVGGPTTLRLRLPLTD